MLSAPLTYANWILLLVMAVGLLFTIFDKHGYNSMLRREQTEALIRAFESNFLGQLPVSLVEGGFPVEINAEFYEPITVTRDSANGKKGEALSEFMINTVRYLEALDGLPNSRGETISLSNADNPTIPPLPTSVKEWNDKVND